MLVPHMTVLLDMISPNLYLIIYIGWLLGYEFPKILVPQATVILDSLMPSSYIFKRFYLPHMTIFSSKKSLSMDMDWHVFRMWTYYYLQFEEQGLWVRNVLKIIRWINQCSNIIKDKFFIYYHSFWSLF